MATADAVIEVKDIRNAAQDVCYKYPYIEKITRLAEKDVR